MISVNCQDVITETQHVKRAISKYRVDSYTSFNPLLTSPSIDSTSLVAMTPNGIKEKMLCYILLVVLMDSYDFCLRLFEMLQTKCIQITVFIHSSFAKSKTINFCSPICKYLQTPFQNCVNANSKPRRLQQIWNCDQNLGIFYSMGWEYFIAEVYHTLHTCSKYRLTDSCKIHFYKLAKLKLVLMRQVLKVLIELNY